MEKFSRTLAVSGFYARKSSESPTVWKPGSGWSRAEKEVVIGDGAKWIWNLEKLVVALRSLSSGHPAVPEKIRIEADYFEKNAERMRHPKFRRQHLFVGSGVIEAGCKTVIGARLKQSGMFRTVPCANAILALRCSCINDRFEDYWETRRAARSPLLCRTPAATCYVLTSVFALGTVSTVEIYSIGKQR